MATDETNKEEGPGEAPPGRPLECPQPHKLLAAVDESKNSVRAVDYLSVWAACNEAVEVILVHVIKEPSEDVLPDRDERDTYIRQKEEAAASLLSRMKERLGATGVPDSRIHAKTLTCSPPATVVEALLEEKDRDEYDTIILGRRGMSKKEEYIFGSVTNRLVREMGDISVWVVA